MTDYLALRKKLLPRVRDPFDGFEGYPNDHPSQENHPPPLSRLVAALATAEDRCPNYVDAEDWRQAVVDGRRFFAQWGKQAERLGWMEADLFSLHEPPERPGANYRRLSRVDATGLIWLLHGRPVVALTEHTAAIGTPGGGQLTFYHRPVTRDAEE